jgi:hypothetical protein
MAQLLPGEPAQKQNNVVQLSAPPHHSPSMAVVDAIP